MVTPSRAAIARDPDGASLLDTFICDPHNERVTGEEEEAAARGSATSAACLFLYP